MATWLLQPPTTSATVPFHVPHVPSSRCSDGMPVLSRSGGDGIVRTALVHGKHDDEVPGQHARSLARGSHEARERER